MSDYDHVRDFVSGRVNTEGLDINFQIRGRRLPKPDCNGQIPRQIFLP